MKRLAFAAFAAFWASTLTLIALSALVPGPLDAAAPAEGPRNVTLEELAAHATEVSCWMAIEGRVYDLTGYLPQHPTPLAVLLPWCGKEATTGMRTKGYGRDHSPTAWGMLDEYEIGVLAE